jgi:anaerobic magnesium-protoporphyrin IX monomethyl ester cyclase
MKILLATLHAKYVHSSLALPYLASACADLEGFDFEILELTVNEQQDQLLSRLYGAQADVILFSCYIWNTELTLKLASDLKQLSPDTAMVLGGPEVSFGAFEMMVRNPAIDCIVRGEGEQTVRELLQALRDQVPLDEVTGITYREGEEIVANPERVALGDLDQIPSPFAAGLVDLAKPLVYYETSRGCPFSCAFCMSSIDQGVRSFSMDRIESDLELLLEGGAQTVKLVDRTFNFDAARANRIWRFILDRKPAGTFHFEIGAELLTDANLALLAEVPPGLFRFEIGVQSGGEETLAKVERSSSLPRLFENVRRLKAETRVTVHLDLVAGLPGESLSGFLKSLQGLIDLGPDHIQAETLKVMKGTPMRGIARKEQYAYAEAAPYKVLRTPWLSFTDIRSIDGISRLVDLLYNSGRLSTSLAALSADTPLSQVFAAVAAFFETRGIASNLSLPSLFETLWSFGEATLGEVERERLRDALSFDLCLTGYPGGNTPAFFQAEQHAGERSVPEGIAKGKDGERVRYYRRRFARDYRQKPWTESPVQLTFVYRSAPGAGLQVQVL